MPERVRPESVASLVETVPAVTDTAPDPSFFANMPIAPAVTSVADTVTPALAVEALCAKMPVEKRLVAWLVPACTVPDALIEMLPPELFRATTPSPPALTDATEMSMFALPVA